MNSTTVKVVQCSNYMESEGSQPCRIVIWKPEPDGELHPEPVYATSLEVGRGEEACFGLTHYGLSVRGAVIDFRQRCLEIGARAVIMVTRARGGEGENTLPVYETEVPDLWHLAMWLQDTDGDRTRGTWDDDRLKAAGEAVLETWRLCKDFRDQLLHMEIAALTAIEAKS